MKVVACTLCLLLASTAAADLKPIRVSDDNRNFVTADGKSFFWLADTGWTMVTRLTMPEVDLYLADRRKKRFSVIQLILVPWDARRNGNLSGDKPFVGDDMAQPNPRYFDHVEQVLDRIESHGMYAAVVPFWLAGLPEPGPEEVAKHEAYARYLGQRFGRRQMFWLLGADRWPDGWADVIRTFANELQRSSRRTDLLLTHHPAGGQSSSRFFHDEAWLDFNMLQSGHNADLQAYRLLEGDYAKLPRKPVLDGEPAYENITNALVQYAPGVRVINDYDVRRQAYQSVFSGAAGHSYGACEVYEFHRQGMGKAQWTVGLDWREALQLPGATHMGYLRQLIESRSPLNRTPDNSLIISTNPEDPYRHLAALRDREGRFAYVYTPTGEPFTVDTSRLRGTSIIGRWFNPQSGRFSNSFPVAKQASIEFAAPIREGAKDWVLVLDAKR